MKNIVVVANHQKQLVPEAISLIEHWSGRVSLSAKVVEHRELLSVYPLHDSPLRKIFANADVCLSLGGDGTLLHAAQMAYEFSVPILAVNLGSLGFHTQGEFTELSQVLERLASNDYSIREHIVLEAELGGTARVAFNDVVIGKDNIGRVLHAGVSVDGTFMSNVSADAIVVSTSFGSTAYSYAAGGPLLAPSLSAISLVPVCPHRKGMSPIVLPPDSTITISLTARTHGDSSHVVMDGQKCCMLNEGETLNIRRAKLYLKLIEMQQDYFERLRKKLAWGA